MKAKKERFTLSNALVRGPDSDNPKSYSYWPGRDDNEEIFFHSQCSEEDKVRLTGKLSFVYPPDELITYDNVEIFKPYRI